MSESAGADEPNSAGGSEKENATGLPAIPEDLRQELRETARDRISAYAQAIVSMAPGIGPIVAQALGDVIPNQRIDRIADMLSRLDGKVQRLENAALVRDRMLTEEGTDLLEEGMKQAARALSEERRERIAELLKSSLSDEQLEHLHKKTLFELFDQLNDAEILTLHSYVLDQQEAEQFYENHRNALYVPPIHHGSAREEIDRAAVQETFRRKLESLGLLKARYPRPRKGEPPEFDFASGTLKSRGRDITSLGRLLLWYLDMQIDF